MKNKPSPFIWLQNQEIVGRAKCGCELLQAFDDGPKFYQCELHAAAPDMLKGLKVVLKDHSNDLDWTIFDAVQKAIAKAEGR